MKIKTKMVWAIPALFGAALVVAGCSSEPMMKDDTMDKPMMDGTMEDGKTMQEPMMDGMEKSKSMDNDSMMDSKM